METQLPIATKVPWNKGKLVGQKAPLKLRDIWAIRVRLQISKRTRELALFNQLPLRRVKRNAAETLAFFLVKNESGVCRE